MGRFLVLHPHDVLKDRSNSKHMDLNSNRRKRSPQKKTKDLSKGGGKINDSPDLVMGKVKILKRGEALSSFEEVEKKMLSFDEKEVVSKLGEAVSHLEKLEKLKKKTVSFDENEVVGKVASNLQKSKKKTAPFGENAVVEKALSNLENSKKKTVSFDENEVKVLSNLKKSKEKTVSFDENEVKALENLKKKTVSFDKKMVVSEKYVRRNDELESVEFLKRLGPEPDMVPKKIALVDFYAGLGCFSSPDPSSVPIPGFAKSSQLRRLLNLAI